MENVPACLLLVSEVSLAVVLSVAAGLLLRSFWQAEHLDPSFRPDHLLTAYLRNSDWHAGRLFFPELVERDPHFREWAG